MTKDKIIERINNVIDDLDKNNYTLYFFVIDTMNIPNGCMSYVYHMAYELMGEGYNVTMLYQLPNEYTEEELEELNRKEQPYDESRVFNGVTGWLGSQYSELPHLNMATQEFKVSPADFLFIPEVFSSLMFETYKHNIPCKRYVILHNYNYVTEFIPLGIQWSNYGIYDVISVTENESNLIKSVFPYVRTKVINPCIDDCFRQPIKPKKLVVNIISKDQNDINRIIKPFYWKYPMYKFISFRDIRNFPQEEYADLLKEGAITIWLDTETSFGSSALEAMRCGNIIIAKYPSKTVEWMVDEKGELLDNCIWFDDIDSVHPVIASAIGSWMRNEVPESIIKAMEETNKLYTTEKWKKDVKDTFETIIAERKVELADMAKSDVVNENSDEE